MATEDAFGAFFTRAFKQAYPSRTRMGKWIERGGRMPSWGILVGAVIACWFGQYKIAFWATVFNTLSGGVMVAAIVRDPSWHAARQSPNVRLKTDNDDEEEIAAFVMTKVVVIVVSAVLCWYFGKWAGYF